MGEGLKMAVFDKNIRILMLKGEKGDAGDAGDYSTLANKPKINNVELNGTKSASDLGLVESGELDGINDDIGELQTLTTTDKGSLVNAINEVNGKVGVMVSHILYDSEQGTNGNIDFTSRLNELNHSLSDFKYLEFYYSNGAEDDKNANDDGMCMQKVYKWDEQGAYFDNTINLSIQGSTTTDKTYFVTASTRYNVGSSAAPTMAIRNNNKSVSLGINKDGNTLSNWYMETGSANIYVFRVVGYII